jgi:hypothetical protein
VNPARAIPAVSARRSIPYATKRCGYSFSSQSQRLTRPPISLSATIEMSYSNASLGDDARSALQALSVFRPKPHEFSEDMAQKVAGVGGALLDELDDAGLIECNADRYTMQRTIAEYAHGKLSPEQNRELYHSAVEYFRQRMVDIE